MGILLGNVLIYTGQATVIVHSVQLFTVKWQLLPTVAMVLHLVTAGKLRPVS